MTKSEQRANQPTLVIQFAAEFQRITTTGCTYQTLFWPTLSIPDCIRSQHKSKIDRIVAARGNVYRLL